MLSYIIIGAQKLGVCVKSTALAIVSLCVCSTSSAMDIKGIALGTPWQPDVIARAFDSAKDVGDSFRVNCSEYSCTGYTDIGPCIADVYVTQEDGRVNSILITFPPEFFDRVEEKMLAKFGKPTLKAQIPKQNGLGASFQSTTYTWTKGDETLLLEKFAKANRSSIYLSAPSTKPETGGL